MLEKNNTGLILFFYILFLKKNEDIGEARASFHNTFPYSYYNYYTDGTYFSEDEYEKFSHSKNENGIFSSVFDALNLINWNLMGDIDRQFGIIEINLNYFDILNMF